jgi:hypothetical protein
VALDPSLDWAQAALTRVWYRWRRESWGWSPWLDPANGEAAALLNRSTIDHLCTLSMPGLGRRLIPEDHPGKERLLGKIVDLGPEVSRFWIRGDKEEARWRNLGDRIHPRSFWRAAQRGCC